MPSHLRLLTLSQFNLLETFLVVNLGKLMTLHNRCMLGVLVADVLLKFAIASMFAGDVQKYSQN